jgi:tetratricopeptide (TPR) repeat protein
MAPASRQPAASVHRDIQQAVGLLQRDPSLAKQKAEEILAQHPDLDAAQQILGVAWRLLGDPLTALTIIEPLAHRQRDSADILHELGLCLGAAGRGADAIAVLRKAVQRDPKHAHAWRSLGDQLNAAGNEQAAEEAFDRHLALSARHPELIEVADLLRKGAIAKAERLTREVLKKDPVDVMAIRMLAAIGIKVGQLGDASNLLERCLELAPGFHLARHSYAVVLFRRHELEQALEQVEVLLKAEPNNPNFLILKGTILVRKGDHVPALELYERLLENYPGQSGAHMNYGHTLKTIGRVDDAVYEYRTSIGLRPATGEAYWSLANLKTFRFSDEDIENIRAQIVPEGGDPEDQAHLAFTLGKALEDRERFDESFRYYALGNAVRRQHHRFNAKINVVDTARQIRTLDRNFFEQRRGWGCPAPEPIFVVGLPRAGSTLLEQILASHSQVEGTAELPDIIAMSRKLGKKSRKNPASDYPEVLTTLSEEQVCELGESYMSTTQVQRRGAPFFIDKMPNNFHHVGLIHLILPNAKIIDARRHPMAGCFSCFKQLFARGQTFTYDLTDLGRYYRDYVALMDHWDTVLPGRVHRVQYEEMVADSESEIRRLLEYCGLEFEEQCLRFYETERAVRTPSSEQVRRPIYKEGVEQWRHYEKHLEPLKKALGPVLDRYPID